MIEKFLALQNGIILGAFATRDEALARVREEQQRDMFSIIFKRSLRKMFKKSGNVALHRYGIITVSDYEEVSL